MNFRRSTLANEFPAVSLRAVSRRWGRIILCSTSAALLSGCDPGDREATVTGSDRRDLVLWDEVFPNNLKDHAPLDWRRVPWTQMRIYNYRFGARQDGEVWLSVIPRRGADAVLQNVNRWYNQFRMPEITSLEDLKQEPMLGVTGYLVEAEGTYHAGMGADPRPETRMLAAAAPFSSSIVTVKMIGSPAEVEEQQEAFQSYCRSLEFFDEARISKPEDE